jgi:hypothetical protein
VNASSLRASVVLGAAALVACSSTSKSVADAGLEGPSDAIVSTPCPSTPPKEGSACIGVSSCPYGSACNQTVSVCTGGFWESSQAVLMDGGMCPSTVPANGADCTICPQAGPCTYNSTCEPDAGPSSASASCTGGHWSVATTKCAFDASLPDVGPEDATSDALSDVHDAGFDVADAPPDADAH